MRRQQYWCWAKWPGSYPFLMGSVSGRNTFEVWQAAVETWPQVPDWDFRQHEEDDHHV